MITEQLLTAILSKITELVEAQVSNYHKVFSIDTATDQTLIIKDRFSVSGQEFANSLYVADIGGGFDLYLNDENPAIPAVTGLNVSSEQISAIRIKGNGAGTAIIRIGVYRK